MSTRSEIRTAVLENLDDSGNDKWSNSAIDRLLARSRRAVFSIMRGLYPGRRLRTTEAITAVADQREYDLNADTVEVDGLERIAYGGVATDDPIPYRRIDYADRHRYEASEGNDSRQGGVYYIIEAVQSSNTARPKKKIGIIPTPSRAGADFQAAVLRRPGAPWGTPGDATQDTYDSGLDDEWEDVLILHATVHALLQKPPSAGTVLRDWQNSLGEAIQALKVSDTDPASEGRTIRVEDTE